MATVAKMTSTTNSGRALEKVKKAFRAFVGKSRLGDDYQFDFEHGAWYVTHKPTGDAWGAVDAEGPGIVEGADFELL